MSKNSIIILIYHLHKLLDPTGQVTEGILLSKHNNTKPSSTYKSPPKYHQLCLRNDPIVSANTVIVITMGLANNIGPPNRYPLSNISGVIILIRTGWARYVARANGNVTLKHMLEK
jgi:hypothetical protein